MSTSVTQTPIHRLTGKGITNEVNVSHLPLFGHYWYIMLSLDEMPLFHILCRIQYQDLDITVIYICSKGGQETAMWTVLDPLVPNQPQSLTIIGHIPPRTDATVILTIGVGDGYQDLFFNGTPIGLPTCHRLDEPGIIQKCELFGVVHALRIYSAIHHPLTSVDQIYNEMVEEHKVGAGLGLVM